MSKHKPQTPGDVRMKGFATRPPVEAAIAWVDDATAAPLGDERVALGSAAGRVLSSPIISSFDVPGFRRGMMDGFALRANNIQGAAAYNRRRLDIVGQSWPGKPFDGLPLAAGQAVRIMTGAPLPEGADCVLPVELTEADADDEGHFFALGEVSPGKHVAEPGEDVCAGSTVLVAGRILRPQDLGVLSSIGCAEVCVIRRPRVRVVATGNELLPPGSSPVGHKIVDANSPMLNALIARDGGTASNPGGVEDREEAILAAMQDDADVILVSGGSSVGQEDHAPTLLAQHGELNLHGIAMRPSSPAGMGRMQNRLVFLLPGNPVSCLCAYDFFAGRAIRALAGRQREWPYARKRSALARKISSVVGRVDYARVQFGPDGVEPLAISGASILSSTTQADGFVVVPEDSEGYAPGAEVDVFLYDNFRMR